MIVQGVTSLGIALPLLVDANGRVVTVNHPHYVYSELGATVVYASGSAQNNTVTVYTVPANKTFYLVNMYVTVSNNTAGALTGRAQITDATPTVQVEWLLSAPAGAYPAVDIPHPVPIMLPTGYLIRSVSPAANFFSNVTVSGYLL